MAGSYLLELELFGTYSSDMPGFEIWADGAMLGSAYSVSSSGTSVSVSVSYAGDMPTALEFRFNDVSGEGGRSIEVRSVHVDGQNVNTGNFLSSNSLTQGGSSTVDVDNGNFLFNEIEPDASVFTTDATKTTTTGADNYRVFNETSDQNFHLQDGRDVVYLGSGDDKVHGGLGNDILSGGGGHDIIVGGDGTDRLFGNDGNDQLYGGDGNDILNGAAGNDHLHGGLGNDRLIGGDGNDVLAGGAGNDVLAGGAGDDILYGQDGDDQIVAGNGNNTVDAGAGDDVVYGGNDVDIIDGGDDDDYIIARGGNDIVNGGIGVDTILLDDGSDIAYGGSGDDAIYGGAGNDVIYGDGDFELIQNGDFSNSSTGWTINSPAGPSAPFVSGDEDFVFNSANQTVFGDSIEQTFLTNIGGVYNVSLDLIENNVADASHTFRIDILDSDSNVISTETQTAINDTVVSVSFDFTSVTATSVILITNTTSSTTYSSDGKVDNVSIVAIGDDTIDGGAGDDTIDGGAGDDTIDGGAGDDTIDGGAGTNTAVFSGNRTDYTITLSTDVYTIVDNRMGSIDGTDDVTNIATYSFSDGDIAVANILDAEVSEPDPIEETGTAGADTLYSDSYAAGMNSYILDILTDHATAISGTSGNGFLTYNTDTGNFYQFVKFSGSISATDTRLATGTIEGEDAIYVEFDDVAEQTWVLNNLGEVQGDGITLEWYNDTIVGDLNLGDSLFTLMGDDGSYSTKNGYRPFIAEWSGDDILGANNVGEEYGQSYILNGGGGSDDLYGNIGQDIFQFDYIDRGSRDDIYNFDVDHGDSIDISDLLSGHGITVDSGNVDDYVLVTEFQGVRVDYTGTGSFYGSYDHVAGFEGTVDITDAATMLANGELIV